LNKKVINPSRTPFRVHLKKDRPPITPIPWSFDPCKPEKYIFKLVFLTFYDAAKVIILAKIQKKIKFQVR
jgi:hypothetical protein